MSGPGETVHIAKTAIDSTLAVSAVSVPFWMQYLQTYIGFFMLIGGAVLLTLRLVIAWKEYRDPRRKNDDGR